VDGEPLSGGEPSQGTGLMPNARPAELITDWSMGRSSTKPNPDPEHPQLLDLSQIEAAFAWVEGYSRPNWKLIREMIEQRVATENIADAWAEAVVQWADQLRTDLGGQYAVRSSPEFVLLSAQDTRVADDLLRFAELTLKQIYGWLKEAAWQWTHGKHVILLFEDQEDYYQYVAYFYPDGTHPASGGCLIHKDYIHIAMPYDGRSIRRALAHELVHNSVVHLALPLWLNEGLAVAFERSTTQTQSHILDGDLQERHLAFWNRQNIQKFWAGVSFDEPGDSNVLSYNLAEILTHLLLNGASELPAFVKAARWDDAGQTAALDVLGADLGQIAGTFLGPGEWRPNRKAISECWKAARSGRAA
jgi:hypothetical protein